MEIAFFKKYSNDKMNNLYLSCSGAFDSNIKDAVWFKPANLHGNDVSYMVNNKIYFLKNNNGFLSLSNEDEKLGLSTGKSLTLPENRKNLLFFYFPGDKFYNHKNTFVNGYLFVHGDSLKKSKLLTPGLWPEFGVTLKETKTEMWLSKPCNVSNNKPNCGSDDGCGGVCLCPDGFTCDKYGFCIENKTNMQRDVNKNRQGKILENDKQNKWLILAVILLVIILISIFIYLVVSINKDNSSNDTSFTDYLGPISQVSKYV